MRKPALIVAPLLLAAMLGGCAAPGAEPGSNPLNDIEKVIDLIPWAKSIAADASADELTGRIAEITAGLPARDIPEATRTEIQDQLKALDAAVCADPGNAAAHVSELNAILDDVKAALQ